MITALIASDKGYLIINPFGIIEGETDFSFYYNPDILWIKSKI